MKAMKFREPIAGFAAKRRKGREGFGDVAVSCAASRLFTTFAITARPFVASLLGCLACWHAGGQSAADYLAGGCSAKGIVVHLYSGSSAGPATVIRLDKVYKGYESKGFYRIGVLPIGIMQGITFELHDPDSVTNSLAQLHQWLTPRGGKRLELRRLSLLVSAPVTNRLETGRAQVVFEDRLALLDGVSFVSGTNQIQAPRGMLQVSGAQAGQLVLATTPPWTNNLFGRIETP
jgi:hypothetical protein